MNNIKDCTLHKQCSSRESCVNCKFSVSTNVHQITCILSTEHNDKIIPTEFKCDSYEPMDLYVQSCATCDNIAYNKRNSRLECLHETIVSLKCLCGRYIDYEGRHEQKILKQDIINFDNNPIMEFKDKQQAYECLKEWQERLFLTDWTIRIDLTSERLFREDGAEVDGMVNCQPDNKVCCIKMTNYDFNNGTLEKQTQEHILVHELLHCKFIMLPVYDGYRELKLKTHEHILLEQMAKSLIMAKYNLDFEWFKNFNEV